MINPKKYKMSLKALGFLFTLLFFAVADVLLYELDIICFLLTSAERHPYGIGGLPGSLGEHPGCSRAT